MLERDIEATLRDAVKKEGGVAYKFTSPGNLGVPDRLIIYPDGVIHFIELKTTVGKLTALQARQIERLELLKADVYVVRGISELAEYFKEAGRPVAHRFVEKRIKRLIARGEDFKL